jgi:hypothetical protein
VQGLPLLPGKIVKEVTSVSSRQAAANSPLPVMVGEFIGPAGTEYVLAVNLSLEKSANLVLRTHKEYRRKEVISAQDGQPLPLDEEKGLWLPAGQGALIQLK